MRIQTDPDLRSRTTPVPFNFVLIFGRTNQAGVIIFAALEFDKSAAKIVGLTVVR